MEQQDDRRLLQLWQRRNWHWYLKKERRFDLKQVRSRAVMHVPGRRPPQNLADHSCVTAQGALHVHWDEASPGVLRVFTAAGLFTQASA